MTLVVAFDCQLLIGEFYDLLDQLRRSDCIDRRVKNGDGVVARDRHSGKSGKNAIRIEQKGKVILADKRPSGRPAPAGC